MERLPGAGGAVFSLLSLLLHFASASEIPLSVPQVPTITKQSKEQVAFPFDEYFQIECEAKGNPEPRFTWTKDGKPFDLSDPRVIASNNSGTFRIPNEGQIAHFQGKYRCFASNKLGVAMSEEIEFIVPNVPKFPKEKIEPLEVEEGDPLVLPCNPPTGLPPLHIYWMNIELEHIQQDERVYMSQEGDLYFANVEEHDSRNDYCCFAAFPRLRTIVQKMPMKLTVNSSNSIKQRKPSLLLPPAARGPESSVTVLRGDTLVLECFAEGLPTPQVDWEKVGGDLPKGRETKENYGKMLKIENVSYEDKGNYRCTANNFLGVATHDFHVTVEGVTLPKVGSQSSELCDGRRSGGLQESSAEFPAPSLTRRVRHEFPPLEMSEADTLLSQLFPGHVFSVRARRIFSMLVMGANTPWLYLGSLSGNPSLLVSSGVAVVCGLLGEGRLPVTWELIDAGFLPGRDHTEHCVGLMMRGTVPFRAAFRGWLSRASIYVPISLPFKVQFAQGAPRSRPPPNPRSSYCEEEKPLLCTHQDTGCSLGLGSSREEAFERCLLPVIVVLLGVSLWLGCAGQQGYFPGPPPRPPHQHRDPAWPIAAAGPGAADSCKPLQMAGLAAGAAHLSNLAAVSRLEGKLSKELQGLQKKNRKPCGLEDCKGIQVSCTDCPPIHKPARSTIEMQIMFLLGTLNPLPLMRHHTLPLLPFTNSRTREKAGTSRSPSPVSVWKPHKYNPHWAHGRARKLRFHSTFLCLRLPPALPAFVFGVETQINHMGHMGRGDDRRSIPLLCLDSTHIQSTGSAFSLIIVWLSLRCPRSIISEGKDGFVRNGLLCAFNGLNKTPASLFFKSLCYLMVSQSHKEYILLPNKLTFSGFHLVWIVCYKARNLSPYECPALHVWPYSDATPSIFMEKSKAERSSIACKVQIPQNDNVQGFLGPCLVLNRFPDQVDLLLVRTPIGRASSSWHLPNINNLSVSTFPPASPRSRFLCSPRVRSSGRGLGKLPEGVNATEKVHPPEVPEPGAEHAVRLLPKNWVGNNSIFEDVIEARGREYAGLYDDIATQGWFIGLMGAVAGLTLVLLTVCFVKRNRGGKYSVKDKEDLHPDPDVQSGKDETFGDYSDSDEKPLKGSLRSLTRDLPATESADSLVPYGDGDHGLFSEDGSFIGAYAGSKEKGSVESNGSSTATFPLRA
uniref:Ig-like domain-containing protein n=1 Tax=Myotis lucifugus TaxID=59463 RepID=G1P6E9_MYOLU